MIKTNREDIKHKIEVLLKSEWTRDFYEVEDVALHESEIWLVQVAELLNAKYVLAFWTFDDDLPINALIRDEKVVWLTTPLKNKIKQVFDEN